MWGYYFHHLIFLIIWQVIEQAEEKITITQNWPCNFIDNYLFSSNHITTTVLGIILIFKMNGISTLLTKKNMWKIAQA